MRFALTAFMMLLILLPASDAHARKLCFGTDETLDTIQKLDIKGPKGEELSLARRITRECFVAPYTVADNGFVLSVAGTNSYYPLDAEKIAEMQAQGTLPNPMPDYKLSNVELAFGHLLWIVLGGLVLWWLVSTLIGRMRKSE